MRREKTENTLIKELSRDMITTSKVLQNLVCCNFKSNGVWFFVIIVIISNAVLEFSILKGE